MIASRGEQRTPSSSGIEHAAILHQPYIELILSGAKTIEARLSVCRIPPFAAVSPGDSVFLRARASRAGAFAARATARRVWSFEDLTAKDVRSLAREFGARVCAPAQFWRSRSKARYATFIELSDVRRIDRGPILPRKVGDRRAWFVLDPTCRRAA